MSYLGMYILTKLDSWNCFTGTVGVVLCVIAGALVFISGVSASESYGDFKETFIATLKLLNFKKVIIVAISLLVFSQLLPTTKQAAFIYIAPQIIENGAVKDTVKNIPELTKLGTDYLKELLKEKVNDIKG